jgi:hypothetical protein
VTRSGVFHVDPLFDENSTCTSEELSPFTHTAKRFCCAAEPKSKAHSGAAAQHKNTAAVAQDFLIPLNGTHI